MPKKMVRLNAVGFLDGEGQDVSDSVYERPVMMVYAGEFDSMDGPVTITESHIDLLAKNHNSLLERVKRLATGDIPMKDCPPLQLDHSTSATMTIGRLVGPLSKAIATIDGKELPALFGRARFLGKENVEKAKDGRYTHVSIGADLEAGVVNELSVTPFPAAPRASLLSRLAQHGGREYQVVEVSPGEYDIFVDGRKISHHAGTAEEVDAEAKRYIDEGKGRDMHEKLKKHLMESRKMSEQDAERLAKECMESQQKKMGKSHDDMVAHMANADDKECKRMADEHDEEMRKLAEKGPAHGGESDAPEAKMARKAAFTKLALGIRGGASELRMSIRKSSIAARLARFRAEAKVTPAELKKLDVAKFASLDDTALEACLSSYEAREPVIRFGSLTGTNKAESIEKITKKYRLERLELETRMNMPSKRAEVVSKLARLAEDEKKELAAVGNPNEVDEPAKGMLTKMSYDDLCKMLDDKSKHEELKKHLKHMMDHHGLEMPPEHGDEHMSALAKKHAELQNGLEQLIALASPALGLKPEDLK